MKSLTKRLAGLWVVLGLFVPSYVSAEGQFRLAIDGLPLSLGNPFRTTATPTIFTTSAMFDGLTRFNKDLQLDPWLSTSWENIDELTWRFTLRANVTFQDGSPFTSEAVVNAVTYIASDESVIEGVHREIPFLDSATAIDDLTVEIRTTEPVPLLPRYMVSLLIPQPDLWRRLGRDGFSRAPIGTGPFKLESWEPNRGLFSRHSGSWRPVVADRLEIIAIPNPSTRVQGIQSGRIDGAMRLGPEDAEQIRAMGGTVVTYRRSAVSGISFMLTRPENPKTAPLQDVRVRRALNMAIDRQTLIDVLLAGATIPSSQPGATGAYGRNDDLESFPYDPAAAKALLAEAGYPDGFRFSLQATVGSQPADAAIWQVIQRYLKDIGVTMDIVIVPIQQYLTDLSRGSFDTEAFVMAWPAWPTVDVLRPLQMHSCLRPNGWYCREDQMPLIEKASQSWDPNVQIQARHQLMKTIQEDAAAIWLFENVDFVGLAPGASGFVDVNGFIDFAGLSPP